MGYTLAELDLYAEAAARLEAGRLAALLPVIAAGAQGTPKAYQRVARTLRKASR